MGGWKIEEGEGYFEGWTVGINDGKEDVIVSVYRVVLVLDQYVGYSVVGIDDG